MRRTYRVRPGRGVSGVGAVVALVFLIGGLTLMNAGPVSAPGAFQLIWVLMWGIGFITSLYNAVSDKGIATDVIQEELEHRGHDSASLLRELDSLHGEGLISDEEYQVRREAVLSKFGA